MKSIKDEILKDISKAKLFLIGPLNRYFLNEIHKIFSKKIFVDIDEISINITKRLEGNINQEIYNQINEHLQSFMYFSRYLNWLRKSDFKKCYEDDMSLKDYHSQLESFISHTLFLNLNKNQKREIKKHKLINQIKEIRQVYFLMTTLKYFERDIFLYWLFDEYQKLDLSKYSNEYNYIIDVISEEFPDLFRKKVSFERGQEHDFFSYMSKIKCKIDTNLLKLKDITNAIE